MMITRSTLMLVLAGSLLTLGAASAQAEESTAQQELRQDMEDKSSSSQPGEGMMDQTNETFLEGSDAATGKRQQMLDGTSDPSNAEGKMEGYNADMLEGSAAATEKRQEMMEDQE